MKYYKLFTVDASDETFVPGVKGIIRRVDFLRVALGTAFSCYVGVGVAETSTTLPAAQVLVGNPVVISRIAEWAFPDTTGGSGSVPCLTPINEQTALFANQSVNQGRIVVVVEID